MLINKLILPVAAAALGTAAALALPGLSPEADAGTPANVVKSDRLDFRPTGPDCSPQAWPYYETHCLRDRTRFAGQARPVRVISTDRIAAP